MQNLGPRTLGLTWRGLLPVVATTIGLAQQPGAAPFDQRTPSRSYYFDWINSQYEGTTEAHSLVNLAFWRWMHDEYGFQLDYYLLDVGNIDDGPYTTGVGRLAPGHHGTLTSPEFLEQFPRGLGPLRDAAAAFGCRLGVWLGPDGFGQTPAEEAARADLLLSLCRDYDVGVLKLDTVAGPLRPEKQLALARALARCRAVQPDLIVLSERVRLGAAAPFASTALWEGAETYVDVFTWNPGTAPNHRAGPLVRPLTPGLDRLLEDHGVCLSSCLDGWEDDLVLQTFGRALLLAPELYGSPWFLRDDELPRLASLCNRFRAHRDILVDGLELPAADFGPSAVARGDADTRFLVLRNPTWSSVRRSIPLDATIGLGPGQGPVELRRVHPREEVAGRFARGTRVEVEVEPFRTCLLQVSAGGAGGLDLRGCEFEVVRDVPGRPLEVDLLGLPGTRARITLASAAARFTSASLDDVPLPALLRGEPLQVVFPGQPLAQPWRRTLGTLEPAPLPADAEALFEATCFAADSNALELRSLERSGPTRLPAVAAARRAFLEQPFLVNRGLWDRQLFDGDLDTHFHARRAGGVLRVDLGAVQPLERVVLRTMDREAVDLAPELHRFAEDARLEISTDLTQWSSHGGWSGAGKIAVAELPAGTRARYLRVRGAPRRLAEVEGWTDGRRLDRSGWRASNLLPAFPGASAAWAGRFSVGRVLPGAYLAVAIEGRHGNEGVTVAARVDGRLVGAPDRAVSFPSNTWEYQNVELDGGYTFFLPLEPWMDGRTIEVVALGLAGGSSEIRPVVHRSAEPAPYLRRQLVLERAR